MADYIYRFASFDHLISSHGYSYFTKQGDKNFNYFKIYRFVNSSYQPFSVYSFLSNFSSPFKALPY